MLHIPVRYQVSVLVFLGWVMHTYLRSNLSIAIIEMCQDKNITIDGDTRLQNAEFNWTDKQKSFILNTFAYGYILSPVGGVLATKYGGATIYGLGIFLTAIFTLLTPLLVKLNYIVFIAARIIEGVFEGTSAASCTLIFAHWAPPNERGRLAATSITGLFMGTAITYSISGYIAQEFGWESVFYVSGTIALLWYILWFCCVTNTPKNHKWISAQEIIFIENGIQNTVSRNSSKNIPWKAMLTSKATIAYLIHKFCVGWTAVFLLYYLPVYIKGSTTLDIFYVGILSGVTSITTIIFQPIASLIFDCIRCKGYMSTTNIYKMYIGVSYVGQCILLIVLGCMTKPIFILIGLITCKFMAVWTGCTVIMLPVDMSPSYSSILYGIGTMVHQVGSIISPTILGFLVTDYNNLHMWNQYFIVLAAINLLGGVTFVLFGSGKIQSWNTNLQNDKEKIELENNIELM